MVVFASVPLMPHNVFPSPAQYKDTALHLATHGGHLNMVKFLVPLFGVRVHAKNIYHQTCRGIAEREDYQHVVEYLDLAAQKAKVSTLFVITLVTKHTHLFSNTTMTTC